jgi:hypothetical protein
MVGRLRAGGEEGSSLLVGAAWQRVGSAIGEDAGGVKEFFAAVTRTVKVVV